MLFRSDKNHDNGIVLDAGVQKFFSVDRGINFYVSDDAFTQTINEKLAPLGVTAPDKLAARANAIKSLAYVSEGGCPIPIQTVPGAKGDVLSNEKLSCNNRSVFQAYRTYTAPKYQELIAAAVAPERLQSIDKVAARTAAQKTIIAKTLNTSVSILKTVDAANQGKVVEASARLAESLLKMYVLFKPTATTEKVAEGSNAIIEAISSASACVPLLTSKEFDTKAALACVDTFRATLEIPQNDESALGKMKPYLTVIVDELKAVKSLTEIPEKGLAAVAALTANSINVGLGILRLTTTESGSTANQMLEELGTAIISPTLNAVSCYPATAVIGAVKLNPIGLMSDCLEGPIAKTIENTEVIARRTYGIYSYTLINVEAYSLQIESYALAELVSAPSMNDLYERWSIPVNTPFDQGVYALLDKLIAGQTDLDYSLFSLDFLDFSPALIKDGLNSQRSVMLSDIKAELNYMLGMRSQVLDSQRLSFEKMEIENGLVKANINFYSKRIGGKKLCFSQGSDHSNTNPYVIDKSESLTDNMTFEFRYLNSGSYTIDCFAYNSVGVFLGKQSSSVVIKDDTNYRINRLPEDATIEQGDKVHVSLAGSTGILPRLVRWDFGDGSRQVIAKPTDQITHDYYSSGTKRITAYILDAYNNVVQFTHDVVVTPTSEQKILYVETQPSPTRFGRLTTIVLKGINLAADLQLSCATCLNGVKPVESATTSTERVYTFIPRAVDMSKVVNDTLVIKKADGTVVDQTNIPIQLALSAIAPSNINVLPNTEINFTITTSIMDHIKGVLWYVGEKLVDSFFGIFDGFSYLFDTVGDFIVTADIKGDDGRLDVVSTNVSVSCPTGYSFRDKKCVLKLGDDSENAFNDPTLERNYDVQKIGLDTSDGTLRLPLNVGEVDSTFPYIWIANSGEGTISKLATRDHYRKNPQTGEQELVKTGQELGRYRTGPSSINGNPSRTTVDQEGNVWVGNRGEYNGSWGQTNNTITKVGLFEFGNCIDRNGNGKIDTSTGKDDVKGWSGYFGDGQGFANAQDECVLQHVTLQAEGVDTPTDIRLIAIDKDNNVFAGGHYRKSLFKVNGRTGQIIKGQITNGSFYGGLIDKNNNLWAVSKYFHGSTGMVHKVSNDLSTSEIISTNVNTYGIALDKYGKIWVTSVNTPDFATFNPADINGTLKVFRQQGRSSAACYAQGMAVDDNDNIFIAGAYYGCNSDSLVGHYKQTVNGNDTSVEFVANYRVSSGPTGVAVDGSGNVWSSDMGNNAVSRITLAADPANAKVDTFYVGTGPYNYSDMTGRTVRNTTNRQGTWEAIFDGATDNFEWKKLVWTLKKQLPEGTTVTAYAKAANKKVDLSKDYNPVVSNQTMTDMKGRFIKVKFSLTSANQESTPEITGFDMQ